MCHPVVFALFVCFGIIFTGLGIYGATKHSDACDVWCKSLTFVGVFSVTWVATYVGFLTCIPRDAIICDGMWNKYGSQSVRMFKDVLAEDVLYWMTCPCLFPCRMFTWVRSNIICCPSPEVAMVHAVPVHTGTAPPQGEPKNFV
jgi:hypothetical protein